MNMVGGTRLRKPFSLQKYDANISTACPVLYNGLARPFVDNRPYRLKFLTNYFASKLGILRIGAAPVAGKSLQVLDKFT